VGVISLGVSSMGVISLGVILMGVVSLGVIAHSFKSSVTPLFNWKTFLTSFTTALFQ